MRKLGLLLAFVMAMGCGGGDEAEPCNPLKSAGRCETAQREYAWCCLDTAQSELDPEEHCEQRQRMYEAGVCEEIADLAENDIGCEDPHWIEFCAAGY